MKPTTNASAHQPAISEQLSSNTLSPAWEPVRLAVSGCGGHACDGHLLPITSSRLAEVTALYDPQPAAAERARSLLGSRHPAQLKLPEDLWAGSAEAFLIASPDHLHCAALEAAVAAGKHVFVEKPLATTTAELSRIAAALQTAESKGLVVSSCHPRRYDPPFVWLKRRLSGFRETLGNVIGFEFDFSYHAPAENWKQARSLLLDHATHEIDLLNFICGQAPAQAVRLADGFDYYRVYGQRLDGIAFSFSGTRRLPTREFFEVLRLRFDRGQVTLFPAEGVAEIWNHSTNSKQLAACGATDYRVRGAAVTENFLLAVRGLASSYLSHEELLLNTSFAVKLAEKGAWKSN